MWRTTSSAPRAACRSTHGPTSSASASCCTSWRPVICRSRAPRSTRSWRRSSAIGRRPRSPGMPPARSQNWNGSSPGDALGRSLSRLHRSRSYRARRYGRVGLHYGRGVWLDARPMSYGQRAGHSPSQHHTRAGFPGWISLPQTREGSGFDSADCSSELTAWAAFSSYAAIESASAGAAVSGPRILI